MTMMDTHEDDDPSRRFDDRAAIVAPDGTIHPYPPNGSDEDAALRTAWSGRLPAKLPRTAGELADVARSTP